MIIMQAKRLKLLVPILVVGLVLSGCGFFNILDSVTAVAQTSSLSYPIVDTGQIQNYNNTSGISAPSEGASFYGQDAQIDGNQPNYVDNGDGTVTDLVTGLMWQQAYSGKMSQSQAASSASSFSLAGYSDWRLPTIKELYSLIDFSGEDVSLESTSADNPFIDTDYFDFVYGNTSAGERIIDSQWATTSIYVSGGNQMFGVNFADGRIKGYGTTTPRGEMQFYVRYVRGNTSYGKNDFASNGDGTISDLATGLMWSRDDSGASSTDGTGMDWEDALAYVQDLNDQNYLGYSDWYLPNAKEMQSIVDYSRSPDTTSSAAIDPIFDATSFTNEDGEKDWGFYWTGTTHASARGGEAAVYVAFGRGLGYMNNRYVDVHGAGCQRSDPKSGSAIPTGRGPQGDTVRVANMVRVVRNAGGTTVASIGDSVDSQYSTPPGESQEAFATSEQDEDFILFAPLGGKTAYLISRDGQVMNEWALSGQPGNSVYLLEGGDLLATYTVRGAFAGGGIGGGVELLTWDGAEVWSFELATDHAHLHHDVEILPNGNVLMISWESKTRQEATAVGLSSNQLPESGEVWSEMVLEYDPTLDQIVWEWHLWDHALPDGQTAADNPEKIDLAYAANPKNSDWWHLNAIDYNEGLDQIVVSSRNVSEIWIIDHNLTTAEAAGSDGDLLYRYGNPAAYGSSEPQELVHQHDAKFIDSETLLIFDNGDPRERAYSRVVELNLPNYSNGLFEAAVIVWSYGAASGDEYFFADHISGAQRLESGNTLICSGTEGRFVEVTPSGETIWEYVNPFESTTPNGKTSNDVFRAEVYSSAFIGQTLGEAAEIGASSSSPLSTQNVAVSEEPMSGTDAPPSQVSGQPPAGGPPGIESVAPTSLQANGVSQLVTITLNPQFSPPQQVQFTNVTIGSVAATSWTRTGDILRAWFIIPSSTPSGSTQLTVTFPGREGDPITFSMSIQVN
jgi:Arylsulfotransferase (ASST)/Protein of unknown function (DUF1566)